MDFNTFQNVVRAGTPFAEGDLMQGWRFYELPDRYLAVIDDNTVPYTTYNEEGTIYTQKNKYFIRNGIIGQINHITWSETLGLPYSHRETNNILAKRRNHMMMSMGTLEVRR